MLKRLVIAAALWPYVALAQNAKCPVQAADIAAYDHDLNHAFEAAGKQFQVDPDLGRAVTMAESSFDAKAVSYKGAKGLMQLMPAAIATVGVKDPFDAHQSIFGGMELLRKIASMPAFTGKPYMVLVAYNAGPYRKQFPSESYHFADRVTAIYWQLKDQHVTHHHLIAPTRGTAGYLALPRCGAKPSVSRPRIVGGKIQPSQTYRVADSR